MTGSHRFLIRGEVRALCPPTPSSRDRGSFRNRRKAVTGQAPWRGSPPRFLLRRQISVSRSGSDASFTPGETKRSASGPACDPRRNDATDPLMDPIESPARRRRDAGVMRSDMRSLPCQPNLEVDAADLGAARFGGVGFEPGLNDRGSRT